MRRFFAQTDQISDQEIILDEEESKHISRVLRLQIGDEVEVVDGNGHIYHSSISLISKHNTILKVNKQERSSEKPSNLWMAVSPTKNLNRWEWYLEKATEIGIGRISPILCLRSERKVLKLDRQIRILKEAMKQSQRLYLPELDPLSELDALLEKVDEFDGEKYIAHCEEGEKELLKSLHQSGKKALILIGPEGDFHPEEIEKARLKGFKAISLGESRLRTETAALAACLTINVIDA